MTRRHKRPLPLLERVEITGVAAEGKALARVNDKVLFVPFAAPGDVLDVQVRKARKHYMEGEVVNVHRLSSMRVEPLCEHFGTCGGCKWQHLPYEKQLEFKQQQVTDNLERIGKLNFDHVEVLPIAGSDKTTFYRNKMEYTFSDRRWLTRDEIDSAREIEDQQGLGLHIPGMFDKVLDIKKCWLQEDPSNDIRIAIRDFAREEGLSFFNLRANEGLLRNLVIRNTPEGQLMVLMIFGQDDRILIDKVMGFIDRRFPDLHSLAYIMNTKRNPSMADLEPVIYKGSPYLEEKIEDLIFEIGPKSFFQTNSLQARKLYGIVRDFAALQGHEVLYDLYTGTGTIACFLAPRVDKVLGIEYVEEAVAHARSNARLNELENTIFLAGEMAEVFNEELMDKQGYPHVIVTDPPRAGMHPKVVKQILAAGADRIVYVSCNPATQARDIELLSGRYQVSKSQAVDMFPQTQHVENVVLLKRVRC